MCPIRITNTYELTAYLRGEVVKLQTQLSNKPVNFKQVQGKIEGIMLALEAVKTMDDNQTPTLFKAHPVSDF